MLLLDLETRSRANLKECGAYEYAAHESTEILCIGYYLDEETFGCVDKPSDLPIKVQRYLEGSEGLVAAFNAQFDREVWKACAPDLFQIADSRWYCVAAQMRVWNLPSSLSDAGRAITGKYLKDFRGPQLIKLLCVPRKDGTFLESVSLMQELREYCLQDIWAMKECMYSVPLLSAKEHGDWLVNERINDTGINIDRLMAQTCVKHAAAETDEIREELSRITFCEITKHTQTARIKKWVMNNTRPDLHVLMERKGDKYSIDKTARAALLDRPEDIHPAVYRVIKLMDEGNRSSVAKFSRMLARSESDGVARGSFVYAGAAQTLRYASRGLQLHNMTRDCFDDDDTASILDAALDEGYQLTMGDMSKLLRPALVPDHGNVFVVGDWSSIEARILPWLADTAQANKRLEVFKQGKDIYQVTADKLFKGNRMIGKVAELALGFGGAAGAFANMARIYGLVLSEAKIRKAIDMWRIENMWAAQLWARLEKAAQSAVRNAGDAFPTGRVSYCFYPDILDGTLICTLPDGSTIKYPRCHFTDDEFGRRGLSAMKSTVKPPAGESEWPRIRLWGGMLAENITQATAAALLRQSLRVCDNRGLVVVAHVHDEIIVECGDNEWQEQMALLESAMQRIPKWATGLPIKAEPVMMGRYGKH